MNQKKKVLVSVFLISALFSLGSLGLVAATNPSLIGISGDMIQDMDQDRDRDQDCDCDCDCDCDRDCDCDCDCNQDQDQDQDQDQNQDQDCQVV